MAKTPKIRYLPVTWEQLQDTVDFAKPDLEDLRVLFRMNVAAPLDFTVFWRTAFAPYLCPAGRAMTATAGHLLYRLADDVAPWVREMTRLGTSALDPLTLASWRECWEEDHTNSKGESTIPYVRGLPPPLPPP